MANVLRAFIKYPDVALRPSEIPNTLEALQEAVHGNIETITMTPRLVAVFNEEGVLLDLPFNMYLGGHWLRGPVIFLGIHGEEFSDVPYLTPKQMQSAIREFNRR